MVPYPVGQLFGRFLCALSLFCHDDDRCSGARHIAVGEAVEISGVDQAVFFGVLRDVVGKGLHGVVEGAGIAAVGEHGNVHQRRFRMALAADNANQGLHGQVSGLSHVDMRVLLDAEQAVGQPDHVLGNIAVQVERNRDRHVVSHDFAYFLQGVRLKVVGPLGRAGAVQAQTDAVSPFEIGGNHVAHGAHGKIKGLFGDERTGAVQRNRGHQLDALLFGRLNHAACVFRRTAVARNDLGAGGPAVGRPALKGPDVRREGVCLVAENAKDNLHAIPSFQRL